MADETLVWLYNFSFFVIIDINSDNNMQITVQQLFSIDFTIYKEWIIEIQITYQYMNRC